MHRWIERKIDIGIDIDIDVHIGIHRRILPSCVLTTQVLAVPAETVEELDLLQALKVSKMQWTGVQDGAPQDSVKRC